MFVHTWVCSSKSSLHVQIWFPFFNKKCKVLFLNIWQTKLVHFKALYITMDRATNKGNQTNKQKIKHQKKEREVIA
jgi:hypothetical protein